MRLDALPMLAIAVFSIAAPPPAFTQDSSEATPRTFLVTIVEARLSEQNVSLTKPGENVDELWAALRDSSKTEWSESVQCTALEGLKTRLMFGRNVAFVAGITESPHGKTKNMTDKPLGTGVSLVVTESGKKLKLDIEYQSSRLAGENNGELPPPDLETNQYNSSTLLELGKIQVLALTPNSSLLIRIDLEASN